MRMARTLLASACVLLAGWLLWQARPQPGVVITKAPAAPAGPIAAEADRPVDEKTPPRSAAQATGLQFNLDGSAASTRIPLDELLRKAAASSDPDNNYIALVAVVACSVGKESPSLSAEDLALAGFFDGDRSRTEQLQIEMTQAKQSLLAYCNQSQIADSSAFLQQHVKLKGNLAAWVRERPKERHIDYYRAAIRQVLANPPKYSAAFDAWLDRVAESRLPQLQGLTSAQLSLVRNELYQRMTGFRNEPESLRTLRRCAVEYVCPSTMALSDAEREQALARVAQLERLMREQRWAELLGPGGG